MTQRIFNAFDIFYMDFHNLIFFDLANIIVYIDKNSDVAGYDKSVPIGQVDPVQTPSGLDIYSIAYSIADNKIYLRFGSSGDESIVRAECITIVHPKSKKKMQVVWNKDAKKYVGYDDNFRDLFIDGEVLRLHINLKDRKETYSIYPGCDNFPSNNNIPMRSA